LYLYRYLSIQWIVLIVAALDGITVSRACASVVQVPNGADHPPSGLNTVQTAEGPGLPLTCRRLLRAAPGHHHHHHQITLALQFPALSPCAPHPLVEPRVPGGGRLARTGADTSSDPLSFAVGSIELTGRPAARTPGLDAGAFRRGGVESRSISADRASVDGSSSMRYNLHSISIVYIPRR